MSLVARHLESEGLPTVVIGSARDIVEEVGVARFVFTDFPLGNPLGPPGEVDVQRSVLDTALRLADTAFTSRTTVQSPHRWPTDTWRDTFMQIP